MGFLDAVLGGLKEQLGERFVLDALRHDDHLAGSERHRAVAKAT